MTTKHPGLWRLGLTDAVRFLVTLEIVAKPEEVGPPVDILRMSKGEVRWIQRKDECSEEEKSQ